MMNSDTFQPVTRKDFLSRISAGKESADKIADDCGFIFDDEWEKVLGGAQAEVLETLPLDEVYFRGVLHRAGVSLWEVDRVIIALRQVGVVKQVEVKR